MDAVVGCVVSYVDHPFPRLKSSVRRRWQVRGDRTWGGGGGGTRADRPRRTSTVPVRRERSGEGGGTTGLAVLRHPVLHPLPTGPGGWRAGPGGPDSCPTRDSGPRDVSVGGGPSVGTCCAPAVLEGGGSLRPLGSRPTHPADFTGLERIERRTREPEGGPKDVLGNEETTSGRTKCDWRGPRSWRGDGGAEGGW